MKVEDVIILITWGSMILMVLGRSYAKGGQFSFLQLLVCFYSIGYPVLMDFEEKINSQFVYGSWIITSAIVLWSLSILWLGTSFSVLPAVRKIRKSGPYKFVRHPIYLSYILLEVGLIISYPSLWNFSLITMAFLSYYLRIRFEESLLNQYEEYREYSMSTKFRLIPFFY